MKKTCWFVLACLAVMATALFLADHLFCPTLFARKSPVTVNIRALVSCMK